MSEIRERSERDPLDGGTLVDPIQIPPSPDPAPTTVSAAVMTEADEDVALGETIAKIKAFKWPVIALAALLGAAGAAYTYQKAPTWEARSSLVLVVPDLKAGGGVAASLGLNQPSPLALLQGVVRSRSELDYVSGRTGIRRLDLEKWLVADTDTPSNQLQISGTHRDKAMALKIVSTAIEGLTVLNRDIGFSTAEKQAAYLRRTIAERQTEFTRKQDALIAYQRRLIVPIDPTKPETAGESARLLSEAKFELGSVKKSIQVTRAAAAASEKDLPNVPSSVPSISALRTKLNGLELELRNLQIQLGDEAADVIYTRRQIVNTRAALQAETARYIQSVQTNVDPRLAELEARRLILEDQVARLSPIVAAVPQQAAEYVRLYREVQGAGEIVQTLRENYERARTEAQVDKVRWSILDQPYLEDKPNNKNYIRNVAVGAIAGIFIGSVWAVRRRPR